jgi:hypothetical protein
MPALRRKYSMLATLASVAAVRALNKDVDAPARNEGIRRLISRCRFGRGFDSDSTGDLLQSCQSPRSGSGRDESIKRWPHRCRPNGRCRVWHGSVGGQPRALKTGDWLPLSGHCFGARIGSRTTNTKNVQSGSMRYDIFQIMGGLALLLGAITSIWNGYVPFKSGFQLRRQRNPIEFWALVIILGCGGAFWLWHFSIKT